MCSTQETCFPPTCSLSSADDDGLLSSLTMDHQDDYDREEEEEEEEELYQRPTPKKVLDELKAISRISCPTTLTGLLLYSRSLISMLFLGHLGSLDLAAGSLALGFANITGYSIISGLAMGMEPICGQAYGARQFKLLGLTLQRTVLLLLLAASIPITILWLKADSILIHLTGQTQQISSKSHTFILYSIPDLFLLSILHPLRIYLRTQNITLPLTYCTALSILLVHLPLNFLLVVYLQLGISGVAIATVLTNFNLCIFLISFIYFSGVYKPSWTPPTSNCFKSWSSLLRLSIPSCLSVCLEWWWYEFMIIASGLLTNPEPTVASMGILIQTTSLIYVFPSSLSLAVSTRVSNLLGANRPVRARLATTVSLSLAAALGATAMCFATLTRRAWGRMFTSDDEILRLTSLALPIVGLCELGNCPQTTGCGVLRGCAMPRVGANINLGAFYLVGLPVAGVLGFWFGMGFVGLWLGLLAAQGCCAVVMMVVLLVTTDWNHQVQRAKELTSSSSTQGNVVVLGRQTTLLPEQVAPLLA